MKDKRQQLLTPKASIHCFLSIWHYFLALYVDYQFVLLVKFCKILNKFLPQPTYIIAHQVQLAMQANCFVFPSPKNYNIAPIENKIILIPRDSNNNRHSLYNPICTENSFHNEDDFEDYLALLEDDDFVGKQKILAKSLTKTQGSNQNENVLEGNLNLKEKVSSSDYIPCLFINGIKPKILLFFHANGEDLSSAYEFLKMVSLQTKYPVLAMEYRGYSIYQGETTPQNIETDAIRVMEFLQANKFTSNQIILFGRSIGCAVALTVTQKYAVSSAILLSPFISLKKIAKDLYGGCAEAMIKEAFDNEENCRQIKCPLLIIHGSKDTLVPYQHSLKLMSGCQSYCRLKVVENMTHTKFNFRLDFIRHFSRFMIDLD